MVDLAQALPTELADNRSESSVGNVSLVQQIVRVVHLDC